LIYKSNNKKKKLNLKVIVQQTVKNLSMRMRSIKYLIIKLRIIKFFKSNRKIRDKQKEEYENLKIEFLTFKKNKLGSQNPEEVSIK
jgi:hypothetical protein